MSETITPHESARNTLVIEPHADVKADKRDSFLEKDPMRKLAYERKRRVKDKSAGAHLAELIGYAVSDGDWTDQELTDFCIHWRRKHGESFKSDPKYYAAIIARAREAEERKEVLRVGASADQPREEKLMQLSTLLGADITSVQRFQTDPRSYVVRLGNGSYLEFKNGDDLFTQSKLRGALRDYASVIMPPYKAAEWMNVEGHIIACVEDVDSADEATHLGSVIAWLRTFVRKHVRPDMVKEGQLRAVLDGRPAQFAVKGEPVRVWFSMEGFKRSIMLESSTMPPSHALLAVRLKQIGCVYEKKVSIFVDGNDTTRSLWSAPDDFVVSPPDEEKPGEPKHILGES